MKGHPEIKESLFCGSKVLVRIGHFFRARNTPAGAPGSKSKSQAVGLDLVIVVVLLIHQGM